MRGFQFRVLAHHEFPIPHPSPLTISPESHTTSKKSSPTKIICRVYPAILARVKRCWEGSSVEVARVSRGCLQVTAVLVIWLAISILEALADLEGINAVVHLGVLTTGSLAEHSVKSGADLLRPA